MFRKKSIDQLGATARVTFDDVLRELGQFGPYQKKIYFLLFLPSIFSAMHNMAWIFLGATAPHRCRLPDEPMNSTYDQNGQNLSHLIPYLNGQYDKCMRYDDNMEEIPCDQGWIYDRTTFGSSAVMEWNLVCDDRWLAAFGQSMFMAGSLIGALLFGKASDCLGRRPTFLVAVVSQALLGLIAGILPNYWAFISTRMIMGMANSGTILISYILGVELVGPDYRLLAGTIDSYFWTFGYFLMAFAAYFLNGQWQHLQIVMSAPSAVFIIYWWVIPESVRWLISKGRFEESKEIISKISAQNGTSISEETIAKMFITVNDESGSKGGAPKSGVLELLRHPSLRQNALIMFYIWFVTSGTYYGLVLSTPDLGGNPYINFIIAGAVEMLAHTIVLLILNKLGRKVPLSVSYFVAGLALLIVIFIDPSNYIALLILSMIGMLGISISYNIIYIYSTELFPTSIRSMTVGICSIFAGFGSILCPFLNMMVNFWRPLPLIAYGGFAISAGLLSLFLPETLDMKLPETIMDGENLAAESRRASVCSIKAAESRRASVGSIKK